MTIGHYLHMGIAPKPKPRHHRHLWLALALLITACQAPPFDPDSPLSTVPPQSLLQLHTRLTIPANSVSLWFQGGQLTAEKLLNRYHPHCKFETLQMQATPKLIHPDRFVVHKINRWDDYAMNPVNLVAVTLGLGMFDVSDGASHLNMAVEMFLRSTQQPDVYRLVCSHWQDAGTAEHVSVNEIRQALGKSFTLSLPQQESAISR